jgi:dTDP-4-dehydrorhamnose 3,5-epimerase-like enzyme
MSTIKQKVELLKLPKILDSRGNLSFFENFNGVPFKIARIYWIYDVPGGEVRGGHAYKDLQEVIVALSGAFDVVLHDGVEEKRYTLNRSYMGLYVPKMIWRRLENFSTNALALIAADSPYNEEQYIRDFEQYISMINE